MRTTGFVLVFSLLAVTSCWMIVSGWRQPRPSLADAVERLRRRPPTTGHRVGDEPRGVDRIGAYVADTPFVQRRLASLTTLRLVGRTVHTHVGYLVVAALLGLVAPSFAVALLVITADASLGLVVPAGLSLLGAVLAPLAVHSAAVSQADAVRVDLRHQLSAYLDMVTMLLAGNSGHEGALEQAAAAGDGLLFRELRRRMREVATTGNSLVGALALVADDFELVELEQVASATALSAAEGAPVARTLAAKCSTLRSTLSADQEAKARVRNDKVTPPLVGMALLFMALIIYPALTIG
ncbi:type II secretion system F family protein [Ilumatobacter coccineus]|uniref:Type II secretion system protein GspF domain-containing protein n=1 Tax=Ilumatobacter coccineus (strain NBRC 103263 / KCTC 29153 / YM16-304) TaxID=1313172 RepID=A0A6C7E8S8_ILUCY|nr:hypothetical protein [Ilumatobacter coccineus]BAN00446.1 hypothetical protein YM304_01320 [Ilumatobacter coccineus YM16-304]